MLEGLQTPLILHSHIRQTHSRWGALLLFSRGFCFFCAFWSTSFSHQFSGSSPSLESSFGSCCFLVRFSYLRRSLYSQDLLLPDCLCRSAYGGSRGVGNQSPHQVRKMAFLRTPAFAEKTISFSISLVFLQMSQDLKLQHHKSSKNSKFIVSLQASLMSKN